MSNITRCVIGVVFLIGARVAVADGPGPLREARSDNKQFMLRIDPGRPGRVCQATLSQRSKDGQQGRKVWERPLVNDAAPAFAFIRDDGRFVVTLDEYRRGGTRNALVIYGSRGELLRHFLLPDLLEKEDWSHVRPSQRELSWLKDARPAFDGPADQFVIRLGWGRDVRIDLKTLQVIHSGQGAADSGFAAVPAEVRALLLAQVDADNEQVIAERLAELAEMSPEEQAQAGAVAAEFSTTRPADEPNEAIAAEQPPEQVAADIQSPGSDAGAAVAATGMNAAADNQTPVSDRAADASAMIGAATPAAPPLANIVPPAPSAANKVDYVAWLNEMGRVEGPDAGPVYEAAIEHLLPWEGDSEVLFAAASGDPQALQSEELAAWLTTNEEALAAFRQASRYEEKGDELHSESGSMMEVVLPDLSPMRTMARATVIEGRQLAAAGQPDQAAERYLDALAAGAHAGNGLTFIENLVGIAMQAPAAEALIDLQADTPPDGMDYAALAEAAEAAYRPARAMTDTVQCERAFYLDTVQRMWDADPATGECRLNVDAASGFLATASDEFAEQLPDKETALWNLAKVGFEQTVADGQAMYDELTEAFTLPYPAAQERLRQIETQVRSDSQANPAVRMFVPSLSRAQFVETRAETVRRATLLVTNLNAYRQQFGGYPASLDGFAGREFAVDPFGDMPFTYRREGDSFVLYSIGGNGTDDGGVHDRKGDTNDLVFWPRPK